MQAVVFMGGQHERKNARLRCKYSYIELLEFSRQRNVYRHCKGYSPQNYDIYTTFNRPEFDRYDLVIDEQSSYSAMLNIAGINSAPESIPFNSGNSIDT
jgi:hypothetical protein